MQLDDLFELWKVDSEIDRTELGEASTTIPKLHYKYYKLFSQERLTLRKLQAEYKILYKEKWEYYQGNMSEEVLKEKEWDVFPLRVLKSDVDKYIDSDKDMVKHNYRLEYQKEKIDFLENVIRSINNRGFQIKNAIDWEKFKVGI